MTRRENPDSKHGTPTYTVADLDGLDGMTAKQQAEAVGCSVATIFALRKEKRGTNLSRPTKRTVDEILPYAHLPLKEQMKALGASSNTVARLRREAGIKRPARTSMDVWRVDHLPTRQEQADALGISFYWLSVLRGRALKEGVIQPMQNKQRQRRFTVDMIRGMQYLTAQECADILGCTPRTIFTLRRELRKEQEN